MYMCMVCVGGVWNECGLVVCDFLINVTGSEKTDHFVVKQFVQYMYLKRCQGHEVGTSQ